MKKTIASLGLIATTAGLASMVAASASAATAPNVPVALHACNSVATRTYAGVTYTAPAYKSATVNHGLPNSCTLAYGSKGSLVTAAQKGMNTFLQMNKLKPITVDGIFGPQTKAAVATIQGLENEQKTGLFDVSVSELLLEPMFW